MNLYSHSGLEPIAPPRWRVERDAQQAAQTHWQPSEGVAAAMAALPRDLARIARERWDSIGGLPIRCNSWTPAEGSPYRRANVDFWQLMDELKAARFDIGTDDAEISMLAERVARIIEHQGNLHGLDSGLAVASMLASQYGTDSPDGKKLTPESIFRRFCDPSWWRRRMRAQFGQAIESSMRSRGLVCKTKAVYSTDWAVERRRSQRATTKLALQNAVATNEDGEQLSLFDLAEHSIANPAIRRGELMTRARGFEEAAKQVGHTWTFATLTTPSAFHAMSQAGGRCFENLRYQGESVRAGQAWLCKQWSRARAKLKRLSIEFYGFRVAEPHHDGTVHWHMLLFCAPHHIERLQTVIRAYWLKEYSDEPGASMHRVKFKDEQANIKGSSAAGYLAKYIGKNIDGHAVGEDYEAGTASELACERVEAWATCHRIRQFQQIGGPSVGLWRELRRVRAPVPDADIERARIACGDVANGARADWAAYIDALGGLGVGKSGKISLYKESCALPGKYGDARGDVVKGIQSCASKVLTRVKRWVLSWWTKARRVLGSGSDAPLGPVAITVRGGKAVDNSRSCGKAVDNSAAVQQSCKANEKPSTEIRSSSALHPDLPAELVEGAPEYWQWFRATGQTLYTRLAWIPKVENV